MTTREVAPAKTDGPGLTLRRASPFSLLQHEIDRVFDTFANWRTGFEPFVFTPSMNVCETDAAIEVSTELPGMDEKDVEISIANDMLSIRGEKKAETEEKGKNYRVFERSHGAFERVLALPPGIKPEDIKASMSKGVLRVTLPKPAAAQQQKIVIAVES